MPVNNKIPTFLLKENRYLERKFLRHSAVYLQPDEPECVVAGF